MSTFFKGEGFLAGAAGFAGCAAIVALLWLITHMIYTTGYQDGSLCAQYGVYCQAGDRAYYRLHKPN